MEAHTRVKVKRRRAKGLPTCLDADVPDLQKLAVLTEELGEVANLFNQSTDGEPPDMSKLRVELLDLATAASLFAESKRV